MKKITFLMLGLILILAVVMAILYWGRERPSEEVGQEEETVSISGKVISAITRFPVPNATLEINGRRLTADRYGKIEYFSIKPGVYIITAHVSGYEAYKKPIEVKGGSVRVTVELQRIKPPSDIPEEYHQYYYEALDLKDFGVLQEIEADQLCKDRAALQEWIAQNPGTVVQFDRRGAVTRPDGSIEVVEAAGAVLGRVAGKSFNKDQALEELKKFESLQMALEDALEDPDPAERDAAVKEALEALETQIRLIAALAEGYRLTIGSQD